MSGPLTQVLDALTSGVGSLAEVSRRTGLSPEAVSASVDHLVRMGRLDRDRLNAGCPSGGCGGCPLSGPDGGRCGTGSDRGPVLLTLSHR